MKKNYLLEKIQKRIITLSRTQVFQILIFPHISYCCNKDLYHLPLWGFQKPSRDYQLNYWKTSYNPDHPTPWDDL